MIKPILKIELPAAVYAETAKNIYESLKGGPIAEDYHILVVKGTGEFINIQIIIAPDITIHK